MYTILVIITSKWKITTLLVFEKISFKRWEVYYVGCQGLQHKSATVWLVIFFYIPNHFRQIKDVLTSIFKYIYCSLTSYKNIDIYCLLQYLTSDINFLPFLSDNKKHKVSSILLFRHLVQVTDTLESQFWGIRFFSWHSNQKTYKKCRTSALQQSMTMS